jgi:hypothetical protein
MMRLILMQFSVGLLIRVNNIPTTRALHIFLQSEAHLRNADRSKQKVSLVQNPVKPCFYVPLSIQIHHSDTSFQQTINLPSALKTTSSPAGETELRVSTSW